jgi:hypothetical protein
VDNWKSVVIGNNKNENMSSTKITTGKIGYLLLWDILTFAPDGELLLMAWLLGHAYTI